jgi:hypothetical protein
MRDGDAPSTHTRDVQRADRRGCRFEREGPGGPSRSWDRRRPRERWGKKLPQAIRLEPCSFSPVVADAGTRGPTFGTGSRV